MKSPSKTKQAITEELAFLRRRVQELEQAGSVHEKTAEALARAAKEWQETFDATRDAIWILDQDHRLLRSNKTAEHFFNLSCGEMIGKRCWEIVHGTTQPIPECPMLRAQKSLRREIMQLHVGESWFEVIVDPILDGAGQFAGAVHIVSDITDRKRAEEALRESEIRYQSIFENTGTVMLIVEEDMTISFANAEFEKLTGYTRQEVEGKKKWTEFVEKADLERMIHQHGLRRTDKNRAKRSYEFRLVHRDGHTKDILLIVDIIPGTKKSVASLIDISDRKQAEEELRESRRRLEDIIEFLPDATLVVDREGRVIAWNRAMETMTGVRKEDMLGKGNYEYALPFYGERRPILIDYALHPYKETEQEYTTIRRMGNVILGEAFTPDIPPGDVYVHATASVLHDSKGNIIAAIECIRDDTERKKLADRLNRAEKMEALGTLAGGVAHDLNNVLGVLVGYSELLGESLPKDSSSKRYADSIVQSALRGAAIIQDLLTLARRGVHVSEAVNLNRIVSDYLATPEYEKLRSERQEIKFRIDLTEGLLNVKGSPVHLSKTIANLVSNAAEAISGRGDITIATENRYLDIPVQGYDDMPEGDYVVLTVSDTGKGIAVEDMGKIFEPFYTKKVMGRSGTGLGLTVVWGTVKDHNGYIDVQSEEGAGSAFTIYFPVTREETAKRGKIVDSALYRGNGERILVVDDVKEQRELAISMLKRLGYAVEAVAGGEEAIDCLRSGKVDLMVLDMIMDPGIDGLETYRRALEINPRQKAVIVSGFSETARVEKAQEMGAGTFVRKPYVLEKIGLAVRKELDRK